MGIFGLLFGTGSGVAKDTSTEEERYTSIKKTEEKREIRDAEYREIEPSEVSSEHDRHPTLKAKMFGGRFIKRTPQEEEKIQKAERNKELKKAQEKQAEAAKRKERKEAFDKAYKEEEVKIKARQAARKDNRRVIASARMEVPKYANVFIPAFGMVKSAKSSSVSYSEHGVYPFDLVQMGITNSNSGSTATSANKTKHSPVGSYGLSNPLFTSFFGGNGSGKHSKSNGKGVHPLSSFGFSW